MDCFRGRDRGRGGPNNGLLQGQGGPTIDCYKGKGQRPGLAPTMDCYRGREEAGVGPTNGLVQRAGVTAAIGRHAEGQVVWSTPLSSVYALTAGKD